ncbi:MAG: cell division protein ZapA [Flammeovirgaceae bacterium]|nr:cell division protein ZapA [Flammeovirgaceae bacterium]MDW8287892.1 cell division protein ZapA [Flammeovirgaceae bacterium]
MKDSQILIKILDKEYPLKLSQKDKDTICEISRLLNERLTARKDKLNDKQDLLAITLFDVMVENYRLHEEQQRISERLAELEKLVAREL